MLLCLAENKKRPQAGVRKEEAMEKREGKRYEHLVTSILVEPHKLARAMQVVRDKNGDCWLCDKGVDPEKDLRKQGCWQCGGLEMPFTRQD